MKRIALVILAALALAVPAQAAKPPTAQQFKSLKSQVSALQKTVKQLKNRTADLEVALYFCTVYYPVSQFSGYMYSGGTTTALDVDDSGTEGGRFLGINPDCWSSRALARAPFERLSSFGLAAKVLR